MMASNEYIMIDPSVPFADIVAALGQTVDEDTFERAPEKGPAFRFLLSGMGGYLFEGRNTGPFIVVERARRLFDALCAATDWGLILEDEPGLVIAARPPLAVTV